MTKAFHRNASCQHNTLLRSLVFWSFKQSHLDASRVWYCVFPLFFLNFYKISNISNWPDIILKKTCISIIPRCKNTKKTKGIRVELSNHSCSGLASCRTLVEWIQDGIKSKCFLLSSILRASYFLHFMSSTVFTFTNVIFENTEHIYGMPVSWSISYSIIL